MSGARAEGTGSPRAGRAAPSTSAYAEAERIARLGYWYLDLESSKLVWSDEIYRIFELDPKRFAATYEAFLAAIHPEDREYVSKAYAESVKSRIPYDIVHRLLMQDGRIKFVHERCETFYDAAGKPLRSIGTVQDITERKQTEDALRRTVADLNEAQRVAHVGSWRLDSATNEVVWSEELYRMLGMDPALPPPHYTEHHRLFTPESWNRLNASLSRTMETGIPYELELEMIRADGSRGWMLARGELQRDERGRIIGVRGTAQDISERVRSEEDLRRFRAAMDASGDAIVLVDRATLRYVDFNQTFCDLVGYTRQELLAMAPMDVFSAEQATLERDYDAIIAGKDSGVIMIEGHYRRKDGTLIPVESRRRALHTKDGWIIVATARDIRDRKLAEQDLRRFRLAIDATEDSIYLTDPATMRFVDVNRAACRRLGYTREQLLAMGPLDVLGADPAQLKREYEQVMAAGEQGVKMENTFVTREGRRGWTELHRRAFRVESGWLIVTVGRDITDRKRAEKALMVSEQRFRSLTQISSDWYWEMDEHYNFRATGLEAQARAQLRASDSVGRKPWEIPDTSVSDSQWAAARAVLDARETFRDFEFSRPGVDGKRHWVSISGEPTYDEAGRFTGYRGVGSDITNRKVAEEALRESESHLRLLVDNVPAMIAYVDADRRYLYANRRYLNFYAQTDMPIVGMTLDEALGDETWQSARAPVMRALAGEPLNYQGSRRRRDGRIRMVDVSLVPNKTETGRVLGLYILAIDVTRRHRAEKILKLRNRAVESSVNSIMITEPAAEGQRISYVNPAFERITGYPSSEVLGRSPRFLHGDDIAQPALEELRAATREQREATVLLRNYRKDSTLFWNELRVAPVRDEEGRVTHFIGVGSDVSDRVRYQSEIERNANYDALTGLPNRNLLGDRLTQAIANIERTKLPAAVLYIDLDQFKRINDSLGHEIGDQVIASVGVRLVATLRSGDTVARWGGDEFVAVLTNLSHEDDVTQVAEKLRRAVAAPLAIDGHEFVLSASVGIALAPKDGADGPTLLRNADAALYRAKEQGRDCLRFFAAEMNEHAVRYLSLEHDLRVALNAAEFWLQYQPIVQFSNGQAVGVEALLRWRRPDGRVISPAEFIPVAEESGLIVPMGRWVLETAARQAAAWNRGRNAPLYVSVNLSARQFRDPGLVDMVRVALEQAQLDPALIKLEITETTVMHNAEDAVRTLRRLKELGVLLSVDDFGTGYSSLSYLKRFPIDTLKIDRSFVRDLPGDRDDLAICRAVIDLAQGLGLDVIAEGIETVEQAEMLSTHGCQFAQGFLYSRPVDPGALEEVIRSRLPAPAA